MVAIVTLIYVGKKKNKKISLYKSFNITWLHCDNPSGRAAAVHLQLQNLLCLIHQLGQAYAHMHKHCTNIRKHACTIVQTYARTDWPNVRTCTYRCRVVQTFAHTHYTYTIKAIHKINTPSNNNRHTQKPTKTGNRIHTRGLRVKSATIFVVAN